MRKAKVLQRHNKNSNTTTDNIFFLQQEEGRNKQWMRKEKFCIANAKSLSCAGLAARAFGSSVE